MTAGLSGGGLAGLDNGSVAGWCTNGLPGAGSNTQQRVDEIHHGPRELQVLETDVMASIKCTTCYHYLALFVYYTVKAGEYMSGCKCYCVCVTVKL